jgi:hypothetical protein
VSQNLSCTRRRSGVCQGHGVRAALHTAVRRSVRERCLVGSGLFGEGLVGEAAQDPFVESGERVEFGGGEQVDEEPPDAVHVLGGRVLDDAALARWGAIRR